MGEFWTTESGSKFNDVLHSESGNLGTLDLRQRCYADLTYVDITYLGPVPLMVVMVACAR